MTRNEARTIEPAVASLAQELAADPHLHAEVLRARRQFFGSEAAAAPTLRGAADTAEQRFAEWFVLERTSETLGAVPCELPRYQARLADADESLAGVFVVLSVSPRGVEASDLQDEATLDLAVPEGSLQPGDLLVGRLYPFGSGRFLPSTAAAVFRPGKDLGEAFRRDVGKLELERRLQQVELEHLLLRRPDQTPSPTARPAVAAAPAVPLERLEADLERLLQAGGSTRSAAAISQQLAAVVRPGSALGPLLDELAFDSAVDLDAVRELLLQIWNAYHPEGVPAAAEPLPQAPGESLGERLARTLDEGLRQKRDVDELFAQLEQIAGLPAGAADEGDNPFDAADDDSDDDDSDDESAPDPGGDLGPLVQEYLWELGIEGGPVAETLATWVELQGNAAVPRTDLELVTGQDLMRLLLHVYLGAAPAQRSAAVRAAFAALQEFYRWAERTLELPVGGAVQECRGALLDQLDRLETAGHGLSTASVEGLQPGILQIEDVGPQGFGVRDDEGGHHWLQAPPAATAALRVGDLVLGALQPRGSGRALAGLVVVLPHDARALME
jgi:hypothetical protein